MAAPEFYDPPLPRKRNLQYLNTLTPDHFSIPIWSIKNRDLTESAKQNYLRLFLTQHSVSVKRTERTGFGLFADEYIPQDSYIIEYCGERVLAGDDISRRQLNKSAGISADYMAQLTDEIVLDATFVGNKSRYINHSCNPNTALELINLEDSSYNILWLYTLRGVPQGTQLCMCYGFCRESNDVLVPCRCGEPSCIGWL